MSRRQTLKAEAGNIESAIYSVLHYADIILLVGMAVAGMYFGIRDFVRPKENVEQTASLILSLLGLLALHFALQRGGILRHLLATAASINENTEKLTRNAETARVTRRLLELQELWVTLSDSNRAFTQVSQKVLAEPQIMLNRLTKGIVDVPESYIHSTFDAMLDAYQGTRFDAVSNEDLSFWFKRSDVAEAYLKRNVDARLQGTYVSRVFIFTESDLTNSLQEVVSVLERQRSYGIE